MKILTKTLALILLSCVSSTSIVLADSAEPKGWYHWHGEGASNNPCAINKMSSYPETFMDHPRLSLMGGGLNGRVSNLTDSQRSQIAQLRSQMLVQQRQLMPMIWRLKDELASKLQHANFSQQEINESYAKLADLQKQAFQNRVQTQSRMFHLLTKSQQKQMEVNDSK